MSNANAKGHRHRGGQARSTIVQACRVLQALPTTQCRGAESRALEERTVHVISRSTSAPWARDTQRHLAAMRTHPEQRESAKAQNRWRGSSRSFVSWRFGAT